ncbi:hypothetical protein QLQ12_11220 [Actinoplanes sp. NEAU-A12]|uniref:Uncharacterized protein n=1 Tax=Actinoplanes sandaracinus TaxID=3045177 RepID=A0ABT6WHI9_9ACTN|nr:hypothetical protein [Actinoplanes sandaracinus]MDI6099168.1 hypothetical protein [Actinoplanes sandaracinus]
MSPRTLRLPLVVGALLLSAACGSPPESLPTRPPLPRVSGGLPAGGLAPSAAPTTAWSPPAVTLPTLPGNGTPPPAATTRPATPTTPAATSPSPTPSRAARCAGEPTGAQVVDLAKKDPAVPEGDLAVVDGPYCSGTWSFTMIGMTGAEPLSVVATGVGAALTLVTAGTDVCNPQVKAEAPAGIRALACGF